MFLLLRISRVAFKLKLVPLFCSSCIATYVSKWCKVWMQEQYSFLRQQKLHTFLRNIKIYWGYFTAVTLFILGKESFSYFFNSENILKLLKVTATVEENLAKKNLLNYFYFLPTLVTLVNFLYYYQKTLNPILPRVPIKIIQLN